jgi:hypothetical protein
MHEVQYRQAAPVIILPLVSDYPPKETRSKLVEALEYEDRSHYMMIHKRWRYYLLAAFLLAKISLGIAVFSWAEYRIEQKLKIKIAHQK